MTQRKIQKLLEELREQLANEDAGNGEAREDARRQIQAMLEEIDHPAGGLRTRLQDLHDDFVATHPDLAAVIAGTIQSLGNIGV